MKDYMNHILVRIYNEPVLLATAIRAFLYWVMAVGLSISPEQMAATMTMVEAILAIFTRGQMNAAVSAAYNTIPDHEHE